MDLITFCDRLTVEPLHPDIGSDDRTLSHVFSAIHLPTRAFQTFYQDLIENRFNDLPADTPIPEPRAVVKSIILDFLARSAPHRATILSFGAHHPLERAAPLFSTVQVGANLGPGLHAAYVGYKDFHRWVTAHPVPFDEDSRFEQLAARWARVRNEKAPLYCVNYGPGVSPVHALTSFRRIAAVATPPEMLFLEVPLDSLENFREAMQEVVPEGRLSLKKWLIAGWGPNVLASISL